MGDAPLTVARLWHDVSGRGIDDDLCTWPPDVALLTSVVLERSQAYRFAVCAPCGQCWPPHDGWGTTVSTAAAEWCAGSVPALVRDAWTALVARADTPIAELASGAPWPLCAALLTLHAVADEACGTGLRGRGGELLARTGSLSRIATDRVAVLPKARTTGAGITERSLSRYTAVRSPGVDARWHKAPARRHSTEPGAQHAHIVLLPWPLRVRETDFHPVPSSVRRLEREPFGFFEYAPGHTLDLDLVDRVLAAALDEVEEVDVVVLPEAAVDEHELDGLEQLLAERRVPVLITGVRARSEAPGALAADGVHLGVLLGGRWWRYRQRKHHRWFLDDSQVEQYQLGGALHPGIRWWEAMEIPPRCVQFLELGEGVTIAAAVCEDLARMDGVAELLRAVGPTLVVTVLLDGPQLASRWTAKYASVLADDPGSAVLTISAYGMVQRCAPPGFAVSPMVAMWKDPRRGLREIPLEPGAHGVLLTASVGRTPRYAAAAAPARDRVAPKTTVAELEVTDLTVLAAWADAIASGGDTDDLRAEAPWRADLGLSPPDGALAEALAALARVAGGRAGDSEFDRLARRLLRS